MVEAWKRSNTISARLRALVLVLWSAAALAQGAKQPQSRLDDLAFARKDLQVHPRHVDGARARAEAGDLPSLKGLDGFIAREGAAWRATVDLLNGRPTLIEGSGVPWIPGKGNALKGSDLGLPDGTAGKDIPVRAVERKALEFLAAHPDLLGVDPAELVLDETASGPSLDYLYFLDFRWTPGGIPVEGARVTFRLNHGNLVQFGQERTGEAIRLPDPSPSISLETAWQILWAYLGGRTDGDLVVEPGRLLIVPALAPEALEGRPFSAGDGLRYRLAYVLSFQRDGVLGGWEARVDAHSGEIMSFRDTNLYGSVHGGVYATDRPATEVDRPLPYADIGGGSFADGTGAFPGGDAHSTLSGRYVRIVDACGPITLSSAGGDLDFGSGTGTDCATPVQGGAGNTHASRTQYYHVNAIKAKASSYLPNVAWVTERLTDNVNLNLPCNAFFSPQDGTVNFTRSGPLGTVNCGNTGEFPGALYHEWAHALDSFDGTPVPDPGSSESYGDITAILMLRDSCPGRGVADQPCGGYGDPCTDCTSLRDADYMKHHYQTPYTPNNFIYYCPESQTYLGPCGKEGHCESNLANQALWDLASRDLPGSGMDQASAWNLVDQWWWSTRAIAGAAYTCEYHWQTQEFFSDGCAGGNLHAILRLADDCDGNLANGTPHAAEIFSALERHAIRCGYFWDADNQNQTGCCPSLPAPALAAAGPSALSWSPVPGAVKYRVMRNETGCNVGYTPVAETQATTFTDGAVAGGATYFYQVVPYGPSLACMGRTSNCVTLTAEDPCTLECAATVPAAGTAGAPVPFSATAAASGCPGAPSFLWAFGDGQTSSQQDPSHAYAAEGTYAWTLAVSLPPAPPCTRSGTVAVAPATPATLVLGTSAGQAGGNLCVDLALANPGTPAIAALSTDITFDPSRLTPTGVTTPVPGKVAQGALVAAGIYRITVSGGTKAFPSGVVASVCFDTAAGQCATYPLGHATGTPTASDAAGSPMPIAGTAGSITTTSCGGIPGDCDGNGAVSIGEVQRAINMYLGLQPPGCGADCNANGSIAIGETQKVVNAYLGLTASC